MMCQNSNRAPEQRAGDPGEAGWGCQCPQGSGSSSPHPDPAQGVSSHLRDDFRRGLVWSGQGASMVGTPKPRVRLMTQEESPEKTPCSHGPGPTMLDSGLWKAWAHCQGTARVRCSLRTRRWQQHGRAGGVGTLPPRVSSHSPKQGELGRSSQESRSSLCLLCWEELVLLYLKTLSL